MREITQVILLDVMTAAFEFSFIVQSFSVSVLYWFIRLKFCKTASMRRFCGGRNLIFLFSLSQTHLFHCLLLYMVPSCLLINGITSIWSIRRITAVWSWNAFTTYIRKLCRTIIGKQSIAPSSMSLRVPYKLRYPWPPQTGVRMVAYFG